MAINPQITLGRKPEEVGVKDAIHIAIVSCRAGEYLTSSEKVTLNEHREAVAPQDGAKHIGIVDPFLKGSLAKGDIFWMVMIPKQDQVVRHVWEHKLDFSAPERAVQECEYLAPYAKETKTLSPLFKLFNCSKTISELDVVLMGILTHPGLRRGTRTDKAIKKNISLLSN